MRNRKLFFRARLRTELFSLCNARDAMHRELRSIVLLKKNRILRKMIESNEIKYF